MRSLQRDLLTKKGHDIARWSWVTRKH